jgi:pre-mRNA-splicing factor 38A
MANRTDRGARQIKGMNPQFLLETIIRNKIYGSIYWKEKCFALTANTLIDRAIELLYIGGSYGANKHPTDFMCLVLKLLQIQPEDDIINEYLQASDYKYLVALAAFYIRLTFKAKDVYLKLEPLLADYRKLRARNPNGSYYITHIDEFIESLLTTDSIFEISLPPLTKRRILEINKEIEPRISLLEADLDLNEDQPLNEEEEDYLKNIEIIPKQNEKSDSEDDIKNNKKQRKEVQEEQKLDPNSAEYWLELRKKLNIPTPK